VTIWCLRRGPYDHPKDFIQLHYEPGKGDFGEGSDAYGRVVLGDGKYVYESIFCPRIMPTHVEGRRYKLIDEGLLDPAFDFSFGSSALAWQFLGKLNAAMCSLREEGQLTVIHQRPGRGSDEEFWLDPARDYLVVRFRLLGSIVTRDISKQWEKAEKFWYVKRMTEREECIIPGTPYPWKTRDTEIVLDSFEPNVPIPSEVFGVHALGLTKRSRIRDEGAGYYNYRPDPTFDMEKVERTVGKLPPAVSVE
jgi:hypothetical protein